MHISDLPHMRQDFLTRTAESWTRLSGAWTDTVRGLLEGTKPADHTDIVPGWMNPWAFRSIVESPSTVSLFQEMIDSAARDLPELPAHGTDERTVKNVKDKWLRSYRNVVGEMFGIPRRSEAQRFPDQWRTYADAVSGSGSAFRRGLFPDFSAMMSSMKLLPESGSGALDIWITSYNKMLDRLFRSSCDRRSGECEDRYNRAICAQDRFFKALSEFQEQIVSAGGRRFALEYSEQERS